LRQEKKNYSVNCPKKPFIIFALSLLLMMIFFSSDAYSSTFHKDVSTENEPSCVEQNTLLSSPYNHHQKQSDAPHHCAIVEDAKEEKHSFFEMMPLAFSKLCYAGFQVENHFIHLHRHEKQALLFPVSAFLPECYILYHQLKSDLTHFAV
jgi:hypothetical protein